MKSRTTTILVLAVLPFLMAPSCRNEDEENERCKKMIAMGKGIDELAVEPLIGDSCLDIFLDAVCHSKPDVPKRTPADIVKLIAAYRETLNQPAEGGDDPPWFRSADDAYPCGDGPNGTTLCANPAVDIVREAHFIAFETEAPIPLNDSTNLFQIGFVFDADADPSNNYAPVPEFANDFFEGTDRWYVADYSPAAGWTITVSDATDSVIQTIPSDARIMFDGNVVGLLVPVDEMLDEDPAFRLTAFRHTGDFGINEPHDWDASVFPPQHEPLQP